MGGDWTYRRSDEVDEGLGAVGLTATLGDYTNLGGTLMVFALPK